MVRNGPNLSNQIFDRVPSQRPIRDTPPPTHQIGGTNESMRVQMISYRNFVVFERGCDETNTELLVRILGNRRENGGRRR